MLAYINAQRCATSIWCMVPNAFIYKLGTNDHEWFNDHELSINFSPGIIGIRILRLFDDINFTYCYKNWFSARFINYVNVFKQLKFINIDLLCAFYINGVCIEEVISLDNLLTEARDNNLTIYSLADIELMNPIFIPLFKRLPYSTTNDTYLYDNNPYLLNTYIINLYPLVLQDKTDIIEYNIYNVEHILDDLVSIIPSVGIYVIQLRITINQNK